MPSQPRKSKLYTRTGDRGKTVLAGGRRVSKDHPRVIACGEIDELNSAVGVAISSIRQRAVAASLRAVQNELFEIGAELSSEPHGRRARRGAQTAGVHASSKQRLEGLIDEYDSRLPPIRTFVLPSGSAAASQLHLARAVCRRAERSVVALSKTEAVNPAILTYLNRLSDLLFVLARYANKAARSREHLWRRNG